MSEHIAAFIDAMRDAGVGPSNPAQIVDDDRVNRYHVEGDKPKSENGTYALKVESDGFACGWFISH